MIEDLHTSCDDVVVFCRKDATAKSGFLTLGGCTVRETRQHWQSILGGLQTDGYVSVNTIFQTYGGATANKSHTTSVLRHYRRRGRDLRWLNAGYVDIDCGKLDLDPGQVWSDVVEFLSGRCLPLPTHVSFSGNGLWLFWKFVESIRAWPEECDLLKRLNQQLVSIFRHFGADPNSVDAARVTRCAGTINSKNGKTVRFFRVCGSQLFQFKELLLLFEVPPQKTHLPSERKSREHKNPNRVEAGKLRYGRRLNGFRRLCQIRGPFKINTRRQAIFGLAVLLFKNGVPKKEILAACIRFGAESCKPPITDKAEIERKVNAAFRYKQHISDEKFVEWFHITPAERLQLPDWFRSKLEPVQPVKLRIARRRDLVRRERESIDACLSNYQLAQALAKVLKNRHGIEVTSMTVHRDLDAIGERNRTRSGSNIFLLKDSLSPPFKQENVSAGKQVSKLRARRSNGRKWRSAETIVVSMISEVPKLDERSYYCRGCGRPLPAGFRGLFHAACLKEDKRCRVRQRRRQEYERFARWLRQQTCPRCGASYDNHGA